MAKSNEPIWWSLFSAGGVVAAFLIPLHIFLMGIAWPMGLVSLEFDKVQTLLANPLVRLYCFVLISLPLFHWAHRFRFILVHLGLKNINTLLAVLCYGAAIAGTVVAGVMLWA
ncbi:MAG: fumarate reductase subunit D [Acidobacteria bacterium]|nr:fumarate reductase subunit D [Acidobacteriota bacterium]